MLYCIAVAKLGKLGNCETREVRIERVFEANTCSARLSLLTSSYIVPVLISVQVKLY